MFTERIKKTFKYNEPIFTEELLILFSDYSRAQVFRFINSAKTNGELIQYSKGVYFLPAKTRIGNSTITADDITLKRYIENGNETYGLYSGIKLLNSFGITTQMAGNVEIITNNESAKCREIQINNRNFTLHRSRCIITKENVAAYTIMQLFSDLGKYDKISSESILKIQGFISMHGLTQSQIFSMAQFFPARATQKLVGSRVLNGAI